jgi:hypothetical protein
MAVDPFIERAEPGTADSGGTALETHANAALARWIQDHPQVADQIRETVRAHTHLQELEGRTQDAEEAKQEAEHDYTTLVTRLDPGGRRVLGFAVGAALVVALVVLDAIPLNWAAQAFGLDSAGTWLVTLILVVASVGAMLGFELTSGHRRPRGLLSAVAGAGYLGLLGLRTDFLITVASESPIVALLQATMLTAISAGLVLCGSAVLSRTRSLGQSRSRTAAHRARQAAAEARTAQNLAGEKVLRHIGGLRQVLLPWALSSAAPAGADRAEWASALERAVRRLFPAL